MKRIIYIILPLTLFSCASKKKYTYIEDYSFYSAITEPIVNNKEITLEERSDSAAFISAYTNYKLACEMGKKYNQKIPTGFDILNAKGVSIKNIEFTTKESKMKRLDSLVLNMVSKK